MATKTIRIHVALPEDLVAEIDRMIGPRKRSQFIAELVERELRWRRRVELAEKMAGSLANVDIPGWETSESTAEWVRELRRQSDRYDTNWNRIER